MATSTLKKLRTNPFETYRDPVTGQWIVVKWMADKKNNSQLA